MSGIVHIRVEVHRMDLEMSGLVEWLLSSVSMTLLLLRNNYILLYQSLNFVLSLSNNPGSETMFFGIIAYSFVFIITSTGATDIALSDCSVISSEVFDL